MAVLGVQLVVTLFTATLMHRMAPYCSFARWLLCNGSLFRYKHPSEEELRALAEKQKPRGRRDRRPNGPGDEKPLLVPRDVPLQLETCPLTQVDTLVLRFFLEYQWFVDFSVYAGGVYLFTEAYFYLLGPREANISVFWCLLIVAFSIKVLATLTQLYFSVQGGERAVCCASAFLFLLLAMLVQAVREDVLELGLEPGLASVTQNLEPLLKQLGWDWALPVATVVIRVGLAMVGSVLGAFLTFPGLRLAQTHRDALTMAEDRPLLQLRGQRCGGSGGGSAPWDSGSHPGSLSMPQVPSAHQLPVSTVCPVALDQADRAGLPSSGARRGITPGPAVRLGLRLAAPVGTGRAVPAAPGGDAAPPAGLPVPSQGASGAAAQGGRPGGGARDPAAGREVPRRGGRGGARAGRVLAQLSRPPAHQVVRVSCYVTVVTLQYLTPLIFTLYCTLLLKSLGCYSWGLGPASPLSVAPSSASAGHLEDEAQRTAAGIAAVLRGLATPLLFRGILAFLIWWTAACQLVSSLFGLYFHQHLAAC